MLQILGNKVNYMQLLNLITMGSGVEVNKTNTKSYDVCQLYKQTVVKYYELRKHTSDDWYLPVEQD